MHRFFLLLFLSFTSCGFAQVVDDIKEQHLVLFEVLTKHGGEWVAENPNYDKTKVDDFKWFLLKTTRIDPLRIDAEILGVNTQQDTLRFWTFSEFYAPDKKKNLYFQRSTDGQIYGVGEATMTATERYCEMTFYNAQGIYFKHKDTHTLLSENKMRSVSYDYDPKSQKWVNKSVLTWTRKF